MGKPTVELVLAGDSTKLSKAFGEVGTAADKMKNDVGTASKKIEDTGKGMDDLADKAGTGEQRFTGFSDVITGTGDVMQGFKDGSLTDMAMGFADLAGGLEGFLIPALSGLAGFMKGGLSQAMTFVSSHPLLITVGLLAAAFVLLWTNSEKFRDIVIGVFNSVADFAKRVFGGALDWVIGTWDRVVGWFGALPQRIGAALGSLGGFIGDAFKFGLNKAVEFLNFGIDRINNLIYGVNLLNPFADIPAIPHVPRLHTGGVLPGAAGEEALFVGLAGEVVSAPGAGSSGSGGALSLAVAPGADSAVGELLSYLFRNRIVQLQVDGVPVQVVG